MRFVYDNPRQVPGEYNPVEHIAQISPTPLLLPARNDALAPAAFAIAAFWWRSCLAIPGTRLAAGLGA
jgi:hypothetical protein